MQHLGVQHEAKPVTATDKIMSKRHLKHRAEIKEMVKSGKDKIKTMKKSIEYNKAHAKEHMKALKDMVKAIRKEKKKNG